MMKKLKKILQIVILVLPVVIIVLLMGFARKKQSGELCKTIDISISGDHFYIGKGEIAGIVNRTDTALLRQPVREIQLKTVEKAIRSSPFVKTASVYTDVGGVLKVDVEQRQPLVRIFNKAGRHFYIDTEGYKMPLSPHYSPRVLVVSGHITESFDEASRNNTLETELGKGIYRLAQYLGQQEFWRAQFGHAFVDGNGEIELIPKVGSHRVLLGDISRLEDKLQNLMVFYRKAMPRVGWETYRKINLKYEGQVIGIKNVE